MVSHYPQQIMSNIKSTHFSWVLPKNDVVPHYILDQCLSKAMVDFGDKLIRPIQCKALADVMIHVQGLKLWPCSTIIIAKGTS